MLDYAAIQWTEDHLKFDVISIKNYKINDPHKLKLGENYQGKWDLDGSYYKAQLIMFGNVNISDVTKTKISY